MLVLGHRGASVAHAENTPAAFAGADAMGADGVELDVRLATDSRGRQRLVVHHDPLPAGDALSSLPSLEEVLDACGDRMLVNVEIKNHHADGGHDPSMAVVAPTIHALRARGPGLVERVLISSFSAATVEHCRRVAPEIPTALLATGATLEDGRDLVEVAVSAGHAAVHPHHGSATPEFVATAHDAGLAVNVWTVNDPERIVDLASIGVDGVCTDVPDDALRALGRRAGAEPGIRPQWPSTRRPGSAGGTPA